MRRNIWRTIFSGLSVASLLINSLPPVSLASRVYAQESTPSTTPIPTILPSLRLPVEPSLTSTSSASPELSSDAALPIPQLVNPTTSAESASLSRDETPLNEEGKFPEEIKDQQENNYVEGEVIVKFKKSRIDIRRTLGKVQAYVFERKFSLDKTDEIRASNIQVFRSEKSTEEMVEELKSDPNVEYAEPNYKRYPATISSNDADKDKLWGLDNIGQTINGTVGTDDADIDAPEAWGISEGSGNVIIAVIDSGVAYNHADLSANMWDGSNCRSESGAYLGGCNHGYDFEGPDNTPLPTISSHGTHVAGTISAAKDNGEGITGVAPQAKIMAIKIDFSSIVLETKAIDFAIQNGAKIINASFGGPGESQTEHDAIERFRAAGGIFVAAVGNGGSDGIGDNNESNHHYPSDYDLDNIVSVAATDQNDNLASFSNYGVVSVDVGAPGTNIYSTVADFDGSYGFKKGTSMATPHVAGLAALIWGYRPELTYSQVKGTILDTGDQIDSLDGKTVTGKRINAFKALQSLLPPPNQPPVLGLIGNQSVNELVDLNFKVTATDPEGNPLTYSLSGEPTGATIDSSSGDFSWTPTEAQGPGDYTFTIQVSDGTEIDSEGITITVNEVNTAPVALDDNVSTNEDTAKPIILGATDSDLPAQILTYAIVSGVSYGTLEVVSGNQVIYTPNADYNGADSFTFKANDGAVDSSVAATVSVTVNAVNDAPVISKTAPTMATEDILYTYDANFIDLDGPGVVVWSTTGLDTCGGTVDSLTGVYTFTPAGPVPSASCVLEIKVNDGGTPDLSGTETTTITIGAVNDGPTITTAAPTTATEDTLYTYDADVSDPDGPGVIWSKTPSDTCGGNLDSSTGVYTFTPAGPVPSASCVLVIEVSDEGTPTLSAIQTATIIINAVNEAPIAVADGYSTSEDTTLNVAASGVLNNDSDLDSPTLSVVLVGGVSHGTLSLNTDGSFVYNPALNYNGADSFTYKVSDGTANSNTATVSITVIPVNDAPIAQADNGSVDEDTALIIAKNTLLANDSDIDGDSLTLAGVANPTHGTVSVDTDNVVFVPATDFFGIASFDYTVSDGDLTGTATVTVTVNPVNDAPVADPQSILANEDTMVTIDLSGSDVDGDSLNYAIVTGVEHGTLSIITGNRLTYTPSANYAGSDSFTFKVNDGQLDSSPATVSITVDSFDDPPILDSIGDKTVDELTNLTFIATATDPDSPLTYSLINAPAGAAIDPDSGVFNFTPTEAQGPREYTLTVKVTDGTSNDSEEITITVNEVNTAPVALDDNISTNEDAAKTITLRASDSDLPANSLNYSIVSNPSHGVLSLSGDEATFTPDTDYAGNDTFTFKANDGTDDSNTAAVSISVDPVNDPPVANNDTALVSEDTKLTIAKSTLLANDADVDVDPLILTSVSNPVNGSVSIAGNNIEFVPNADFSGSANFDYTVSDGIATDTGTVSITVNPVNDAPIANVGSTSTNEDVPVTVTLSGSDVEGDPLTYSIVDNPSNGTLGVVFGNQVTYTPSANFHETDSFKFKANDGTTDSNTATVTITVNPINDAPTAQNDTASVEEDTVLTIAKSTLLANDTDVDGDSLTLTSVSSPVHGTVTIDGDNVVFTPSANYSGPASFHYTISDGTLTHTATVAVTVNPVNDAPVANDVSATTSENTPVEVNLSASDLDGGTLTYSIVATPSHGTLGTISGNRVTYTPGVNYNGSDSFTFKANDSTVDSNVATVSITVNPPPVISNEGTDTLSETGLTITWATDHPSTSRVIYDTVSHAVLGTAPNYGYADSTVETDASPKVTSHSVTIDGLTTGTTYYYRVVSQGSPEVVGDENSFTTTDVAVEQGTDNGTTAGTTTSSPTELPTGVDGEVLDEITEGSAPGVLGKEKTNDAVHEDKKAVQKGADLVNNEPEVLGQSKSNGNKLPLLGIILLIGIVSFYFYKRKIQDS